MGLLTRTKLGRTQQGLMALPVMKQIPLPDENIKPANNCRGFYVPISSMQELDVGVRCNKCETYKARTCPILTQVGTYQIDN